VKGTMRHSSSILALAFVIFTSSVGDAACVTHFYNKSNFPWSISGFNGPQSNLVVAPNTTVDIPWGTSTAVVIGGEIPQRPYTRHYQTQSAGDCFLILHPGNTGNVILNKPASGDVTTCADNC
jgi:hypothetical protein